MPNAEPGAVEHSYEFPSHSRAASRPAQDQPRRWRTVAIVLAALAAIELVGLLVFGLAVVARDGEAPGAPAAAQPSEASDPTKVAAAALPAPAEAQPSLPRDRTQVLVLNGSGASGAASTTADTLDGLAYEVVGTANAEASDYQRTVVMYRDGFRGEATRLARDLRLPLRRVGPLDGMRPNETRGAHAVVIIGG